MLVETWDCEISKKRFHSPVRVQICQGKSQNDVTNSAEIHERMIRNTFWISLMNPIPLINMPQNVSQKVISSPTWPYLHDGFWGMLNERFSRSWAHLALGPEPSIFVRMMNHASKIEMIKHGCIGSILGDFWYIDIHWVIHWDEPIRHGDGSTLHRHRATDVGPNNVVSWSPLDSLPVQS